MTAPHRFLRRVVAGAVTVGALFLMARASAMPVSYADPGTARLRLSWSARPERIEVCRRASAEELAREEEHMRQRVECEGHFASYTLRVESDGRLLSESVVRGAGLRHDRPMYLLRDLDLPSGAHRVRVSFTRRERVDRRGGADDDVAKSEADTGIFAGRAQREIAERARRTRAAIPERLALDTSVSFAPGRALVVTFDADRRALVMLGRAPAER